MNRIGLFLSMLMCMFMASAAYAQNDDMGYGGDFGGGQDGYQQSYDDNGYGAGGGYDQGNAGAPCEKPVGDCYCLYCKYEPCYYNKTHCDYVPKYTYKKNCRYVPQYYQKQCCRYVPQYYCQTCCRQVPQYYYTCQCHYVPKYTCERCCKYVPKYYYKHTCAPSCTPNSCMEAR